MRSASVLGVGDVEVAVLGHQRGVLLFAIRNAGWERRDVPVHVRVALVAAEAQEVEALGRHRLRDGASDSVHAALQIGVLVFGEVVDDVGAVLERRDERVADQRRVLREERDADVVAEEHHVVVAFAADDRADEAPACRRVGAHAALVVVDVERNPFGSGMQWGRRVHGRRGRSRQARSTALLSSARSASYIILTSCSKLTRLPTQPFLRLRRVADEQVDLRRAVEALVVADVRLPRLVTGKVERNVEQLADAVRLTGGDHVVVGLVLLEHHPHRFDVVARVAPVAA